MTKKREKTILILGAKGLIGSSLVKGLKKSGRTIISSDITVSENRCINKNLYEINLNLIDDNSYELMWEYLNSNNLEIDSFINVAYPRSKKYGQSFRDIGYEDFCDAVNLHLGGYYLASKNFFEYFEKLGKGNVINFSSIYGVINPKFELYSDSDFTMPIEYAAIKSGINHLTGYFAKYSKGKSIRFNSVCPGGIFNDQDKEFVSKYKNESLNKGLLDPDDIVGLIDFLISDESLHINGQNLVIDDGFSL